MWGRTRWPGFDPPPGQGRQGRRFWGSGVATLTPKSGDLGGQILTTPRPNPGILDHVRMEYPAVDPSLLLHDFHQPHVDVLPAARLLAVDGEGVGASLERF